MKKGIAVAGNLILDRIKRIESYPAPGNLTTITGESSSPGGLVCNCAVDLCRLDPALPVKAVGLLGEDAAGEELLARLGAYQNLDLSHIRRQGVTSYTDVMTEPDGSRTFFHCRGGNALFGPEHIDLKALDADILHIGYLLLLDRMDGPDPEYPTVLCRVLAEAKREGLLTSIDVVSEEGERFHKIVPPALAYADYCVINEVEASRTTGIPLRGPDGVIGENLRPACQALMERGVGRWVVIHMPERSCGLERDGGYVEEPSWRIPPGFKRSSVGAGDAFASGILYGAYRGWSLERAIHTAGAVAAHSLSGEGASDAILPLPELMERMESYQ